MLRKSVSAYANRSVESSVFSTFDVWHNDILFTKSGKARIGELSGIVLMLLAISFMSTMDGIAKWPMENSATPIQLLALRSAIIVPCVILSIHGMVDDSLMY
jgi:hypothetical protein